VSGPAPEGADLRGLPEKAARAWLHTVLPVHDGDDDWSAEVIGGGLSNLTYRIRWGGERLVLRRPPLGHILPRAHDMGREFRVLSALAPTAVPVPDAIAFCDDDTVIGAPFYLMREVEGSVLRHAEDARLLTAAQRGALANQLVDVLADLHQVDPDAIGLADFGPRSGYAERQLRTWGRQWQRSRTRDLPDLDKLLETLAGNLPRGGSTTLVHGDYRFDNAVVSVLPSPRITGVLDWELSTLGDPLADLATMLAYWHDPADKERVHVPVSVGLTTLPGFPSRADLAERYAAGTGRDLSRITFYLALAAMKLAVIFEGVHGRYLSGSGVGEGYAAADEAVPTLVSYGLRLMRNPATTSSRQIIIPSF
jgi:aminoglycoside phosphotransferase (APT) family kinase protein